MFLYIYFISGGIKIHVVITYGDDLLVVFPFRDPKSGPNMSSSAMMLSLVTDKFGSLLKLIIRS